MDHLSDKMKGVRERKRRETLQRIAEIGLRLFSENGYDATTLEEIAAASGISPRTFFYYFKTKDEVLKFWQGSGIMDSLRPALLAEPANQTPLEVVQNCLLKVISYYESEKSVIVDRIFNSSETLRARKREFYFAMEQTIFEALCELWPQPERRSTLRMTAMVSVGAMRLAMETRRQQNGSQPLADYLRDNFSILKTQIGQAD